MRSLLAEPCSREKKPRFHDVPPEIISRLQTVCEGSIASAETAFGGFSSSASFVLTLSDNRKIFVKGTHPLDTSHGAENLRQEIMAYETVPMLERISPKFIGIASDGRGDDGWLLGVWEHVRHEPQRVSLDGLVSVLKGWTLRDTGSSSLVPASSHVFIGGFFSGEKKWCRIKINNEVRRKFLSLFSDPKAGDWLERNISSLCALQKEGICLAQPDSIVHGDLRLDNILFTSDRHYVIDWPNIFLGPRVFDVALLYSSAEAFGLCSFEEALKAYDGCVSHGDMSVMLACLSGYFAEQAYRDVPAVMPRLRWMQRSMLLAQLNQLARLGVIESPPQMHGEMQPRL